VEVKPLAGLAAVGAWCALVGWLIPGVAADGAVVFAALAAAVGLVMAFGGGR
jgi:hypothetical protein